MLRPARWLVFLALALASCSGDGDGVSVDVSRSPDISALPDIADAALFDVPPDRLPDLLPDLPSDVTQDASLDALLDLSSSDVPQPLAGYEEAPLEASETFLARREQFLSACFEAGGPGGGIERQVCRVALGELGTALDEDAIDQACARLNAREDTADFRLAVLIRLLSLDATRHVLSEETRAQIEEAVLNFKYWLSEPGQDKMCYWTENHQILYHSGELLAGQLFPDAVFPNAGMTGRQHVAHALPLVQRWLDLRGRVGFSEWHSNVYFNEDIPALVNLADFAEDEAIREKARMVLDLLAFDLLNNMFDGKFATAHGRTYARKFLSGLQDSTGEAAWLMTGLGDMGSTGNFSGAFLATSEGYFPSPLLEAIAEDARASHEHRQRDSIDIDDGPTYGLGYEAPEDVVIWAGMAALAAPEVIAGTLNLVETYDLWDGFLFGDLPDGLAFILRGNTNGPALVNLATDAEVVSRGIALQTMNTYTYRTPRYQLSGAQDYHPAYWAAQTHMWQATLDEKAFVFTTLPTQIDGAGLDVELAGDWTGSWLPRVTLFRNVGVIQHRADEIPAIVSGFLIPGLCHAYFPRAGFDELREGEGWVVGRKGEAYLALRSEAPTSWSEELDYELKTDVRDNTWIVELGSAEESGSFDAFFAAVTTAELRFDDGVVYASPSVGLVRVGWEGPMTVDGEPVDLGPYPRWQNAYAEVPFGARVTRITFGDELLELNFLGLESEHPDSEHPGRHRYVRR